MKDGLRVLVLLCAGIAAGLTDAREERTFRDYAPVVNVEPIIDTGYPPPSDPFCDGLHLVVPETDRPAATIGEDVRRQIRLQQRRQACQSAQPRHERIRGYWVTYRYQGRTATTRLSYDPGAWLAVDIRLSPLP